jgi:hypothetical protein
LRIRVVNENPLVPASKKREGAINCPLSSSLLTLRTDLCYFATFSFLQQEHLSQQALVSLQRHSFFAQHPHAHSFCPQQDFIEQPVFAASVQHFSAAPAIPMARNIATRGTKNSDFFIENSFRLFYFFDDNS